MVFSQTSKIKQSKSYLMFFKCYWNVLEMSVSVMWVVYITGNVLACYLRIWFECVFEVTPSCKILPCKYEESVAKPISIAGILVSAVVEFGLWIFYSLSSEKLNCARHSAGHCSSLTICFLIFL